MSNQIEIIIKILVALITGVVAAIPLVKVLKKRMAAKKLRWALIERVGYELTDNGNGSLHSKVSRHINEFTEFKEKDFEPFKKSVEQSFEDLNEQQRVSLNLQNVAFWESDKEGKCIYASPSLCKMLGHTESEILNDNWINWIIEEDRKKVTNNWEHFVIQDRAFDMMYSFNHGLKKGQVVNVLSQAFKTRKSKNIRGVLTLTNN